MFKPPNPGWGFALAATIAVAASFAYAEPSVVAADSRSNVPFKSMKDLRDQNVIRQANDYSCGAASLATLLSFGLNDPITEAQVLDDLFAHLSRDDTKDRQNTGFSLLDMQMVAQRRGYKAQAFRLAAKDLTRLTGPVIVFFEPQGYKHFAVLRGVRGDRVFLADPSRGNVRMPAHQFLQTWLGNDGRGIIFVVEPQTLTATSGTALSILAATSPQPEILSARELLAVGASSFSPLGLTR